MVPSSVARVTLHGHVDVLALRPPRDNDAGWEDLFLSGTLQYSQVGLIFLRTLYRISQPTSCL